MNADKRKLESLVADTKMLLEYLSSLSNARLRISQNVLCREVLPELDDTDTFWKVFVSLYVNDRKMWLGSLLKAVVISLNPNLSSNGLKFNDVVEAIGGLSGDFTDCDRQKFIAALLPLAGTPDEAKALLRSCGLSESGDWIAYLLPVKSTVAGFLLLGALRYVESDEALLFRVCRFLMKRGDSLGFSLAGIIRLSYDIKEVRGTFSLHLAPYEISRIEQSFEAFEEAVRL